MLNLYWKMERLPIKMFSIRKYTDEPVSRSIIEKIIDAGRVAPSAKNRQPWKYLVYSGQAKDRLL